MNKTLDETLVTRYPLIFSNRYKSPSETLMCFGFECGDGWFEIIDILCRQIQHHIDFNLKRRELFSKSAHQGSDIVIPNIEQVVAVQVKEKFGTLRFYYDGGDDYILGAVSMAEAMSTSICETCGKPGKLYTNEWWYVACDDHVKEKDKK